MGSELRKPGTLKRRRGSPGAASSGSRGACLLCALALGACFEPTLWLGVANPGQSAEPSAATGDAAATALDTADAPRSVDGADESQIPVAPEDAGRDGSRVPSDAGSAPPAAGKPAPPSTAQPDGGGDPDDDDDDAGAAGPANEPRLPTGLPTVIGRCPELSESGTYTFGPVRGRSLSVDIYIAPDARAKPAPGGPLILYWHAFGSSSSEVEVGFGRAAIDAVVEQGGMVAAFNSRLCASCGLPNEATWYVEDDAISDQVVACAIEQARIDPKRIHALGLSAGALQSLHLGLARSSFVASVISYSGGMPTAEHDREASVRQPVTALLSFGAEGVDAVIGRDFRQTSLDWYEAQRPLGAYALLCEHGGGHEIPSELPLHALRFFEDHPYAVQPEPYAAAIPSVFPEYCSNTPN